MEYIDLDVWMAARKLVNSIYELTKSFPEEEKYGLINQMRRSSVSVASNIAEGCGRQTSADTIRFLHISRGSLYELETQLYLTFDQKYMNKSLLEQLLEEVKTCKRLLNGFINYYSKL
ncbi:four helix bundle protein [Muricauda sp. MAR_2010_75]|jgi:four helix bundle protein|uniref:four helix bundle protein n=1 Tax=Allomuricauda sp. MAR_2010_75 TaxID=1250232 RepID=UPI000562B6B5|nr:four helix bundle protein [Muricauda sp. MAR_2010_75]